MSERVKVELHAYCITTEMGKNDKVDGTTQLGFHSPVNSVFRETNRDLNPIFCEKESHIDMNYYWILLYYVGHLLVLNLIINYLLFK